MPLRIATWNINSVRLRSKIVSRFLEEHHIDILCLQETKVEDGLFPHDHFRKMGYEHLHFAGQKSYNGVAIIARTPLIFHNKLHLVNEDKRHISVTFKYKKKDIELHNIYIPAGGDIPDPLLNPKFEHKLNFNRELATWFSENGRGKEIIVVGDFNIAPFEHDVWSHKQLLNVVSHTPIEVELLTKFRESLGFVDIAREFIPHEEKLYSWWSYRNQDWKKSNRGRRLDHIWATPATAKMAKKFEIIPHIRDWPQPSDHVPVIVEL